MTNCFFKLKCTGDPAPHYIYPVPKKFWDSRDNVTGKYCCDGCLAEVMVEWNSMMGALEVMKGNH